MLIDGQEMERIYFYRTMKSWREYDGGKSDFDKLGRMFLLGFQEEKQLLEMILKTVYVRLYN